MRPLLASSNNIGIGFYSNLLPNVYVSFYDEDNLIVTKTMDTEEYSNWFNSHYPMTKQLKIWQKLLIYSFVIFFNFIIIDNFIVAICLLPFLIIYMFLMDILLEMYITLKNTDFLRFHAAEHMVMNAYRKLGRIPSLEELKNFSMFSSDCGSLSLIVPFMHGITIYVLIAFYPILPIHIFIILILFSIFIFTNRKFNELFKYLEILYVSKPTNKELCLAITGIKKFEEMERDLLH